MDNLLLDKLALRELIENWAIWRDAGFWKRFRTVWHDDGRMMATWTQGTADEFIEMNKKGWERGVSILHFLGGFNADINGNRAVTQTKMTISQRGEVHGVLVDVVCTGRFFACASRSMKRIGWILSHQAQPLSLSNHCLRNFQLVTGTWPISKHRLATK